MTRKSLPSLPSLQIILERLPLIFPEGIAQRNYVIRPMAAKTIFATGKAVVEDFASRFLKTPGVVFLSEPGNKVVARNDKLARSIGLVIKADRNLPDIILVDIGPKSPLLVFVEVVATDGAITQPRMDALLDIVVQAGFNPKHMRSSRPFQTAGPAPTASSPRNWPGVLRKAGPQGGLASIAGGWEGSEELTKILEESLRSAHRDVPDLER
jgi:hypothetical protein